MRRQFGSRWNRRSSEQLTAAFQRELDIVRKYLQEADRSNDKVARSCRGTAGRCRRCGRTERRSMRVCLTTRS